MNRRLAIVLILSALAFLFLCALILGPTTRFGVG
jgi:hypothetical protein